MVVAEAALGGEDAAGAGDELAGALRFKRGSAVGWEVVEAAGMVVGEAALLVWRTSKRTNQRRIRIRSIRDLLGAGETTAGATAPAGTTGLLIMMLVLETSTFWSLETSTGPLNTRVVPRRSTPASWERSTGPEKTKVRSCEPAILLELVFEELKAGRKANACKGWKKMQAKKRIERGEGRRGLL